jgi:hypothetical protein
MLCDADMRWPSEDKQENGALKPAPELKSEEDAPKEGLPGLPTQRTHRTATFSSDELPFPPQRLSRANSDVSFTGSVGEFGEPKKNNTARSKSFVASDGRQHLESEKLADIEADDPFIQLFEAIDTVQELALPLVLGTHRLLQTVLVGGVCLRLPG